MSVVQELSGLVGASFSAIGLDVGHGEVVVSQRPDLGQFQCNGALAAAKDAGRPPRDIAADVARSLTHAEQIHKIEIAGPGFLNLSLSDEYVAQALQRLAADPRLDVPAPDEPRTVVLDYGGPNVAKELHVGHLRTALIGESLKRIYAAAGHHVQGDVHLGDWGLPMGQLIAELEDRHPELPYFDRHAAGSARSYPLKSPVTTDDLQELYPAAARRFAAEPDFQRRARDATVALQNGDPGLRALWGHFRDVSVASLKAIYDQLGVTFEIWFGEATVATRAELLVTELRDQGVAVVSDGAVVIPVAMSDDSVEVPPLMLQNSRGGLTYATTDLATLAERVQVQHATEIVYVVDLRQSLHFTQVFRAARLAGIAPDSVRLIHAGNGTVNGSDGKPYKTRDGTVPRLGSLLEEVEQLAMTRLDENALALDLTGDERRQVARLVGLAALKFGELSNHRTTNYSFDLERFTQLQGRTGPYLLYVAVRTTSIMERLSTEGIGAGEFVAACHDSERTLALKLLQWPDILARALESHSPSTIAEYAYELAGVFNQFYDACHILTHPDRAVQGSWLSLVGLTRGVLRTALDLLLIEIPARM